MKQVEIKIGSITFDRADYDAEWDLLDLYIGEPQTVEGEETPEGHIVQYAHGTQKIVGLSILGPRRVLEQDGVLTVTISGPHQASAEDLAPGFAAV